MNAARGSALDHRPQRGADQSAQSEAATHPTIQLQDVHLSYGSTPALRGVDLTVRAGERIALMGASGCGKSTLLHVIAGVLPPESGTAQVLGQDLGVLPERARDTLRREQIGMVFQFGDLVAELTLRENVMLPLRLAGIARRESRSGPATC
ncbi:ATP-binding cassette domain-containing protein [Ornithinimicrobium sp. Y1847]|uniref:ATP-binding cassette domain-containing protein n=1 Tax=Ornithinimicrobium sp. Y1847 TaxID=3405419 RepID=UPI003B682C88